MFSPCSRIFEGAVFEEVLERCTHRGFVVDVELGALVEHGVAGLSRSVGWLEVKGRHID